MDIQEEYLPLIQQVTKFRNMEYSTEKGYTYEIIAYETSSTVYTNRVKLRDYNSLQLIDYIYEEYNINILLTRLNNTTVSAEDVEATSFVESSTYMRAILTLLKELNIKPKGN